MNTNTIFLGVVFFFGLACKISTTPQPAECDIGFLPCSDNITECCEVICEEWFTPCGSDSTDCCFNCPPQYLPCNEDSTTCCEVVCDTGYYNCGNDDTICCMDSTSHQFSWTIDTLGICGSYLNDVAIVNENNIWVVGNIETDEGEYNAAHWNGSEWELIEIINTADLYSIFYFSENDIWVTKYSYPVHWDGITWTQYNLTDLGISGSSGQAIWGTSSSNMYFVGLYGSIVHYDGVNFMQMESGTDIHLRDIHGTYDEEHIFVTGHNILGESIALRFNNGIWNIMYEGTDLFSEPYGRMKSVDILEEYVLFGCTEGIWKFNYITNNDVLLTLEDLSWDNSINQVFANAPNDIIIISNWGMVNHFNSENWKMDEGLLMLFSNDGSFQISRAAFKEDMIVIVGESPYCDGGIVIKGYRN